MSRRLSRLSLALFLLLSSQVWAVGLGDIRLDSALNEPLRAEISLLSATADELDSLEVSLASAETFSRYGIDRPVYLQQIRFDITPSGADGAYIRLTSPVKMTEPFLTFLVEASWPGGRLLREYTVFLDPPTYVPPAAQSAPAVTAPSVSAPADTGRIERPAVVETPAPRPQPQPQPRTTGSSATSEQRAPTDTTPYGTQSGGDYVVQRSETLWGIASRMRPDDRLTMNQTMVAIYEANPNAFGGNINLLKAGATLRIPSAGEVFQISRGDAFSEVQRQNTNWQSGAATPPRTETRPSLTLVPPDEEPETGTYDDQAAPDETLTREQEVENRIAELEAADVPQQQSLIEIRDTELANLRQELANIRGEVYEPPVSDDPFVDATGEEAPADLAAENEVPADETEQAAADTTGTATTADEPAETAPPVVRTTRVSQPSLIERITNVLTGFWGAIIGAAILIAGLLFWVVRRQGGEVSDTGPWQPLDSDDRAHDETMAATKTIPAPTRDDDDAIVVVEDTGARPIQEDTAEMPALEVEAEAEAEADVDETDLVSIEDTFSSDTAINLDQTDPIAEADFHMAYGLYDQAADLINGALETDPKDAPLLAKLCEVYFVWGNRDKFVDAAKRLKGSVGDASSADWDKTVIMGQQIAADDPMFEDAGLTAATQAIDMAFDPAEGGEGALDMDFGSDDDGVEFAGTDIVDLGEVAEGDAENDDGDADFLFGEDAVDEVSGDTLDLTEEATAEMPVLESTSEMETVEIPTTDSTDVTVESPTVENPIGAGDATSVLPSIEEAPGGDAIESSETAEINLDDLDLDIDQLAETELASLDDLDDDLGDFTDLDSEMTGTVEALDEVAAEGVDLEALIQPDDTGEMRLAKDDTGAVPALEDEHEETDVDIDDSLLEATGITQILDDDLTVEAPAAGQVVLGDDEATMQLPAEGGEFDFAKTEALSPDSEAVQAALDKTGEMPALAETNVDLDLDDLTAALKVSEMGDPAEDIFDEGTADQPGPVTSDTAEIPTMSLAPEEMNDDLHEARTMTEVGTKLDLARAYVDMGDPAGARSILEEVLDEGDESQRQQAQQLLDNLPG